VPEREARTAAAPLWKERPLDSGQGQADPWSSPWKRHEYGRWSSSWSASLPPSSASSVWSFSGSRS